MTHPPSLGYLPIMQDAAASKLLSMIAAATEDDHDSKDDDPGAVIIEEIAKAVVIHMFPPNAFWADPLSYYAV